MQKRPSLVKIIWIDYVALVATLFPIMAWGFYVLLLALDKQTPDTGIATTFLMITVFSLVILAWRVRMFFFLFSDGIEASATISNVFFFRDRGRVDFVFTYQGQKYGSGNAIHKVKQTKNLKVGDRIVVLIDRNNPKRAYIRDLFL